MKLSTRGRYGVRFMLDLVEHGGEGNVPLGDIARRQDISEKYLWQIVNRLKTAGLIHAVPGASGGFTLARKPEAITLRDMLTVLEGRDELVACVTTPDTCPHSDNCRARNIWNEVSDRLGAMLESITLRDMLDKPATGGEETPACPR